jgi:hypothetical protein
MADSYRRQIAPVRANDTLPFARAETFGAGVADAIGNLGGAIARSNEQDRALETQRERDMQASAAGLEFAKIQEEAAKQALEAQTAVGPGGAGYTEEVGRYISAEGDRLLGSIGDAKVRRSFAARLADWRTQSMIGAEAWERGQAVKMAADNLGQTLDIRANRAFRSDAEGFSAELTAWQADLEEMRTSLPPDVYTKYEAAGVEVIAAQYLQGQDPEERLALLDSGLFDSLDPNVSARIRSGAEVDQRRARLEIEAELRVRKAEAKDSVDAVIADLGDGIPRPEEEIDAAIAAANEYGLDGELRRLEQGKVQNSANREFSGASEVAIDQEVKRLNQIIAGQGDNADRETVWRRDHLQQLRERRGEQIEQDPAEFASQNGIAWEPLDFSSAELTTATIAARRQAVSKTRSLTQRPVDFLLPAEREQLRANIGTKEGQGMALAIARQFGGDAPKVMREIDDDDRLLVHALGLQPAYAARAVEGRNLVREKAYAPPKGLEGAIRQRLGFSLGALSPKTQGGIIETASSLYAAYMHRKGDPGEEINQEYVNVVVDRALGNTSERRGDRGGRGGIGFWNGAPFVLPVTMTGSEFGRRLNGIGKLNGAYRDDLETPVTADELREEFSPVRLAGTRYGFRNARNEWVLLANGERAALDLAKLEEPEDAPAGPFGAGGAKPRGAVFVAAPSQAPESPYAKVRY